MRLLTVFFLLLCCSGTCSREGTSLGEGFLASFFAHRLDVFPFPLEGVVFWTLPSLELGASLGASSKEEDLHDFQTYGQEHTRPLVGNDGVGKLPMGSSTTLLDMTCCYWT